MPNPLRSEEAAFRLVGQTIGYFAPIVAASFLNVWLGVAVFLVETAFVVWLLVGRGRSRRIGE